jgi:hypothetical protein
MDPCGRLQGPDAADAPAGAPRAPHSAASSALHVRAGAPGLATCRVASRAVAPPGLAIYSDASRAVAPPGLAIYSDASRAVAPPGLAVNGVGLRLSLQEAKRRGRLGVTERTEFSAEARTRTHAQSQAITHTNSHTRTNSRTRTRSDTHTHTAPRLVSPRPHLRQEGARPTHICARTGPTSLTPAPGLGLPLRNAIRIDA